MRSAWLGGLLLLVSICSGPSQAHAAEYTFARGAGATTLRTGGCDDDGRPYGDPNAILVMRDLNVRQVAVSFSGLNITLRVVGSTDSVTTAFYYRYADGNCFEGLREIRFADGTTWYAVNRGSDAVESLEGTSAAEVFSSFGGNDEVYAGSGSDAVDGGEGDDTLDGEAGDDTLSGAAGADELYGYDGRDVLDGGVGDDDLYGERGSDTYVFSGEFGYDYLEDYDTSYGTDVARFEDVRSTGVTFSRSGSHLLITVTGTARRVKILSYFYSQAYRVEELQFADGVTLRFADVNARVR